MEVTFAAAEVLDAVAFVFFPPELALLCAEFPDVAEADPEAGAFVTDGPAADTEADF